MQVYYLEIVSEDVDAICESYAKQHDVAFSDAEPRLGNARTAQLQGGGMIGVRAPMHESEEPVVRPYLLVDDIDQALATAVTHGGQIAHPSMELPGLGYFAIYLQGGVHHGLWQR